MKVICFSGNVDCENYVYEKEFEIDDEYFDNARCPKCGGKVAPAWIKNFRLPGENKMRTELTELHEKKRKLEEGIINLKEGRTETTYLSLRIAETLGNPSGSHPTVGELVGVLGYETVYDALVAVVKEKGLWKWEEWDNGGILKK